MISIALQISIFTRLNLPSMTMV